MLKSKLGFIFYYTRLLTLININYEVKIPIAVSSLEISSFH